MGAEYKKGIEQGLDATARTRARCLTLFYESSTRTRLSFEAAAHHLGISVSSVQNAMQESSARKGETLEDMGRILSAYADVVVIRHPELGSARRFAAAASSRSARRSGPSRA